MFTLAHISDPHLGPLPDPKLLQLFSKRLLGYLNWQRNRSKIMGANYLEQLVEDMRAKAPDHIAVTGDLVNIALPLEIAGARTWLEEVGEPQNVSVVPGNHDAYVPGAVRRARAAWWPYMCGDGAEEAPTVGTKSEATFPYVRKRGDIALVGVTTGRASAPWFATGRVGSAQSKRLRAVLEDLGGEGLFRVVMLHHPFQARHALAQTPLRRVAGARGRQTRRRRADPARAHPYRQFRKHRRARRSGPRGRRAFRHKRAGRQEAGRPLQPVQDRKVQ